MTTQELFHRFSQGVNWNALLYLIYKCSSTTITILLYNKLDSDLFSTFANLNSIIFLLLLWLDFGFQKAIPRFCPEYAKSKGTLNTFLKTILIFKIGTLCAAIPVYLLLAHGLSYTLQLQAYSSFFYAGAILVLTEGLISVVRLIYHAYFLQKIFNSLNVFALLVEMGLSILSIIMIHNSYILLTALLTSKIIGSFLLLALAWYKAPTIYQQVNQDIPVPNQLNKQFVMHAGIMWFNNNIKSLTERNFLLPLFTFIFGPITANMFKVANDGALLFYRIVLKTIGTTDTALFSHVLVMGEQNETWQIAFKKLATKIAALVLPLAGIIYVIYTNNLFIEYNPYVFRPFLIITICLLFEVLFSPYERVLEVNRCYWLLACAYAPYLIMVITLLTTNIMTSIGLLNSLLLIHGVRLVSTLIMVFITRIRYGLRYPVYFALLITMSMYGVIHIGTYSYKVISPYLNVPPFSYIGHIGRAVLHGVKTPSLPKATASEAS